jgi:hypothetical protein
VDKNVNNFYGTFYEWDKIRGLGGVISVYIISLSVDNYKK